MEEVVSPSADENYSTSKSFWSLFKHAKSDSTGIPTLKNQGHLFSAAAGKASLFNSTFFSSFTYETGSASLPRYTCSLYPNSPEINIITEGIGTKHLASLGET